MMLLRRLAFWTWYHWGIYRLAPTWPSFEQAWWDFTRPVRWRRWKSARVGKQFP